MPEISPHPFLVRRRSGQVYQRGEHQVPHLSLFTFEVKRERCGTNVEKSSPTLLYERRGNARSFDRLIR